MFFTRSPRKPHGRRFMEACQRTRFERMEPRDLLTVAPTAETAVTISSAPTRAQSNPDVTIDSAGYYATVWEDLFSTGDKNIVVRRTHPNGNPLNLGGLTITGSATNDEHPGIVAYPNAYHVVWSETDANGSEIKFRSLTSDLAIDGLPTTVNTSGIGTTDEKNPSIGFATAVGANSEYSTVVWEKIWGPGDRGVYMRRYGSAGSINGSELVVKDVSLLDEFDPDVAGNNSGRTAIVWTANSSVGDPDLDVFVTVIDRNVTIGTTKLNGLDGGKNQKEPTVTALGNGNFAIAYTHEESPGDEDVYVRIIDGGGNFLTNDVPVAVGAGNQRDASIGGSTAQGQFVVAYRDAGSISFRSFSSAGAPRGAARNIDAEGLHPTSNIPFNPSVAMNEAGEFALVYVDDQAQDDILGIKFRNFAQTPGLMNPAAGQFFLRDDNSTGVADNSYLFGPSNSSLFPISGDWDGDGISTLGLYDQPNSVFYLRNSNSTGFADIAFLFGPSGENLRPIAGDWNGDGVWTVGLHDPETSNFFLRDTNSTGFADYQFTFGLPNGGWLPIAGDWNRDGIVSIGLYDPASATFFVRNTLSAGFAHASFLFGPASANLVPLAGDWNRDGVATIGLYDPSAGVYLLRNSLSTGFADLAFQFGPGGLGWKPIMGDWNSPGGAPLVAAGPPVVESDPGRLTQEELDLTVQAARTRWMAVGLTTHQLGRLTQATFVVRDLPGGALGLAQTNAVLIDDVAAGHGWFVDRSPWEDSEFRWDSVAGEWRARSERSAAGKRIDLLTTVLHEMGHLLGEDHNEDENSLMAESLAPGVRRFPARDRAWRSAE